MSKLSASDFMKTDHQPSPQKDPTRARNKEQILVSIDKVETKWLDVGKKNKTDKDYPPHAQKVLNTLRSHIKPLDAGFVIHSVEDLAKVGFRYKDCTELARWLNEALFESGMESCHTFGFHG